MTHVHLRFTLVVLTALVLALPTLWLATRPSRPTSRLGMRGKKRQQALLRNPTWATLEPFVRWMGARVNGVLPLASHTKLETLLTHAGDFLGLTADEAFGCMVASGLVAGATCGALAAVLAGPVVALAVVPSSAALGAALPWFGIDGAKTERFRTINRTLPNVIDLLALGLSAGLDFPGAVEELVVRTKLPETIRDELEYMLQQLTLGHTRAAVLRELATRAPTEAVKELTQSVIQSEDRGNPVAAVLEIQAQIARTRRSNVAETAATAMKGKIVLPTMLLVGVGLALIAAPSQMMIERMSGSMVH